MGDGSSITIGEGMGGCSVVGGVGEGMGGCSAVGAWGVGEGMGSCSVVGVWGRGAVIQLEIYLTS